jgi:hypothetical protein
MTTNRGFFIARKNEDGSHGSPLGDPEDSSIRVWMQKEKAVKILELVRESGEQGELFLFFFDIHTLGMVVE